ncbi:MAG: hypothetical protein GY862_21215 [Gammaproteobacteria bacterium]|nr:hypothetical protein [Gammaproteobacteria bacterium]
MVSTSLNTDISLFIFLDQENFYFMSPPRSFLHFAAAPTIDQKSGGCPDTDIFPENKLTLIISSSQEQNAQFNDDFRIIDVKQLRPAIPAFGQSWNAWSANSR